MAAALGLGRALPTAQPDIDEIQAARERALHAETVQAYVIAETQLQLTVGLPARRLLLFLRSLDDHNIPGRCHPRRQLSRFQKRARHVQFAFQMHFRPSNYSGVIDAETAAILYALNEKYRPEDDE